MYKLKNSLYGLKQFLQSLQEMLKNARKRVGLKQFRSSEFLFKLKEDTHELIITDCVNALVILRRKLDGVKWAKEVSSSMESNE